MELTLIERRYVECNGAGIFAFRQPINEGNGMIRIKRSVRRVAYFVNMQKVISCRKNLSKI